MPLNNATLADEGVNAAILIFADFQDQPFRGAYAPGPVHVPTGLADSDVDCANITFPVIDSTLLSITPVSHENGGTDTFGFQLLGDPTNSTLMSAIETPSLYVGRRVRLWLAIYDPALTTSGGMRVTELRPLYRGYMTQPAQEADANRYVISMQAENYLTLLSAAQSRTYQNSTLYDAGDFSGAVQISTTPGAPGGGGGGQRQLGLEDFTRER